MDIYAVKIENNASGNSLWYLQTKKWWSGYSRDKMSHYFFELGGERLKVGQNYIYDKVMLWLTWINERMCDYCCYCCRSYRRKVRNFYKAQLRIFTQKNKNVERVCDFYSRLVFKIIFGSSSSPSSSYEFHKNYKSLLWPHDLIESLS